MLAHGRNLYQVTGQLKYSPRGVDKVGDTVDFQFKPKTNQAGARRYLERTINLHGVPEKITIDKSETSRATIQSVNMSASLHIELRQYKYLNNIVGRDRRAGVQIVFGVSKL